MAENRYNVDDILREVKAKRAREGQSSQTERKAAATTTEDLLRQLEAAQTGLPKAAKPAAKPGRKDTAAGESRFQPGAGLYDEGAIPEKKSAPRSRGTSGRSAAKGSKKPRSSTAKQPADFDSFNDLDYDV